MIDWMNHETHRHTLSGICTMRMTPVGAAAAARQETRRMASAEPAARATSGPMDAALSPSAPDQRAQSRVQVYVLVEKDDPFVEGGTPLAVYERDQDAWDAMAEHIAIEVSLLWKRPAWHGRSRNSLTAQFVRAFEVWAVPLEPSRFRAETLDTDSQERIV